MGFSIGDVTPYIFGLLLAIIFILGVYYGLQEEFRIDVEYINGILTASSILFGFWAILIERKPKEEPNQWQSRVKKWQYKLAGTSFYASLFALMLSVLLMYLSALDVLSSVFTLMACVTSFYFNAYLLAMTLYYYKFKET